MLFVESGHAFENEAVTFVIEVRKTNTFKNFRERSVRKQDGAKQGFFCCNVLGRDATGARTGFLLHYLPPEFYPLYHRFW